MGRVFLVVFGPIQHSETQLLTDADAGADGADAAGGDVGQTSPACWNCFSVPGLDVESED